MPHAATSKSQESRAQERKASPPVTGKREDWSRTLIVTPTYNEKDNLPRFISEVRNAVPGAHILVVDDNSPDGTGTVADEIASKDDHVRVMHRAGKLGLGTAYTEAFAKGLTEGYERFFEMDADLSHDVQYLPLFARALDDGADV